MTSENRTWVRGNKTCPTEGGNKASSPGMWSPEEFKDVESREQQSVPRNRSTPNSKEEETNANETAKIPFMYQSNGRTIEFKCVTENYIMKCPECSLETRYIVQHVMKGKCQLAINSDTFKLQFHEYKDKDKDTKMKEQRERQQMRRAKLRDHNEENVKEQRRNKEAARRHKLRAENEDKFKGQR